MCFILTGTPICIYTYFQKFPGMHIDVLHDFEMRPGTRKPKILVQTAGHVSGAAYFYQKGYVSTSHWPEHKVLTNDFKKSKYPSLKLNIFLGYRSLPTSSVYWLVCIEGSSDFQGYPGTKFAWDAVRARIVIIRVLCRDSLSEEQHRVLILLDA